MFPRFEATKDLATKIPPCDFQDWPDGTFSFCPKCGLDSFELLYKDEGQFLVRCRLCNTYWSVKSADVNNSITIIGR